MRLEGGGKGRLVMLPTPPLNAARQMFDHLPSPTTVHGCHSYTAGRSSQTFHLNPAPHVFVYLPDPPPLPLATQTLLDAL